MEEEKNYTQETEDTGHKGIGITSMDILQQKFPVKFRGYDIQDVDSFLELVAKEMEKITEDNNHMEKELDFLKKELVSYREKEKSINAALLTVQKITNDVKDNARKEADIIVSEARVDAEKIVGGAKQELAKLREEINALKQRRIQFEASLKALIETHLRMLDRQDSEAGD